ncbi:hypothetical protein TI10_21150 [Photorhabdus luminescens subsp. luminescens]|nr:hypothetical protein TI10_21150 [Photorhabdus luminescens subsp. luminescens]
MKKTLSFIKYIIAASVIFIITMKIIDMITPTSFITSFASFWGIYGIENVMDLYLDTSAMLSIIISIILIASYKKHIKKRKK